MIRYRHLYEGDNPDLGDYIYSSPIQMYDIVSCAGFNWYIIDIKGDIVTLLAKDDVFGRSAFSKRPDDYRYSDIREYIKNDVLPKLQNVNPIPTKLNYGLTDRVWLLSIEEAKKIPEKFRRFSNKYWLRSGGAHYYYAAYVHKDGDISTFGYYTREDSYSVRPAMRVKIEDLD